MKTLMVTGSRGWSNQEHLEQSLWWIHARVCAFGRLIHGDAPGADSMAAAWAEPMRAFLAVDPFPPDESLPSPARFHARNDAMLAEKPFAVAAFRSAGRSPGTDSVILKAARLQIRVFVIPERVEASP